MSVRKKTIFFIILTILFTAGAVMAEIRYPLPGWQDKPNPIASPYAERGGHINLFLGQYPKSLNYYLESSVSTNAIFGLMYEMLLDLDPITLEYTPGLASAWSVSDDGTVMTFTIDPNAYWSDGAKITAHDVLWTFDQIVDPKNLTGQFKMEMQRFERPEVLADDTIRFTAKFGHWKNLLAAGQYVLVMPKHVFENQDFNKINFEFPVVSGPYMVENITDGSKISFKRRDDWWAEAYQSAQNVYNFDLVNFQFFADQFNAYDIFLKGMTDVYTVYSARLWVDEAKGDRFSKNWIIKQRVENHDPIGFQGFVMNMRAFPFNDPKVREAMNLLLDRQGLNETLMFNQYFMQRSYYEDLYDDEHPHQNPLYAKDADRAKALLAEAGYKADPKTGWLKKDGQRLSFKFLSRDSDSDNLMAIYAEALKDVGVEMIIDKKDWAAWMKDMDEFNFQMTVAAWSAAVFRDPESMWSSREADAKSSANLAGFKNARVDELIVKQRTVFDVNERNDILREIDGLIFREHPYVLWWNLDYQRVLYWNKFGTPDTVLNKYGMVYASILTYWWYDENAALELENAQKNNLAMPLKPYEVNFDEIFQE